MSEKINSLKAITPSVVVITGTLTIDYPIFSVTVMNEGDNAAIVQGQSMPSGSIWNFAAAAEQYYPANQFVFDATGTTLTLLINK